MADIPDDPFGAGGNSYRLHVLEDHKPNEDVKKLQELEGIQVPDISAETKPMSDEDRLVKVWKVSSKCNALTFGLVDLPRNTALMPPGACCRDVVIEVPLSEARAKGYTLFTGNEPK